jgi:WD40 repeat protein
MQKLPLVINKERRRFEVPRQVTALAVSADGRQIAFGLGDGTVRLRKVESGEELRKFNAKGRLACDLAFSPDGKRVLCGGQYGLLILWNVQTQDEEAVFEGHRGDVEGVAFSPDGTQLVSTSQTDGDKTVRLWDIASGKELNRFNGQREAVSRAVFAPDGRSVFFCTGWSEKRRVTGHIWNLETGNLLPRFETDDSARGGLSLSGDGRRALTPGSSARGDCLYLWETQTGRVLHRVEVSGPLGQAVLSPNGLYALTGGIYTLERDYYKCFASLYDLESCREICRFEGHTSTVNHVRFSPDGRFVFTAANDGVRLWELPVLPGNVPFGKGEICCFQGHTAEVTSVAFAPDGARVLSGSLDKTVRLWDMRSGLEVRRFEGHGDVVRGVAFTPGGHYVLSGGDDRTLRLWSVANGKELRSIPQPAEVTCVACSPDGRAALTACMDKSMRLWELDTCQALQSFYGHTDLIQNASFSWDGRWIASTGPDGTRIWETATGQARKWLRMPQQASSVAFAPDGFRFLSTERPGWHAEQAEDVLKARDWTGGLTRVWGEPHTRLALSPDERWLLIGTGSNLERLSWAGSEGSRSYQGHSAVVTSVAFAPVGLLAVSGSADRTVRVWGLGD